MSMAEIMEQIRKLPPQEVFALGHLIEELEERLWDQEIERDSQTGGPLDGLGQQAMREVASGQTQALDEFLRNS
jgi:hypothetical protein